MLRESAHAFGSRTPYRGIPCQNQCYPRSLANSDRVRIEPITGQQRRSPDANAVLLPVVFQHLITGQGQLRTILLKASQNSEIALIDHGTAVALYVAGAGLLFVRRAAALLGDGAGGNR